MLKSNVEAICIMFIRNAWTIDTFTSSETLAWVDGTHVEQPEGPP